MYIIIYIYIYNIYVFVVQLKNVFFNFTILSYLIVFDKLPFNQYKLFYFKLSKDTLLHKSNHNYFCNNNSRYKKIQILNIFVNHIFVLLINLMTI